MIEVAEGRQSHSRRQRGEGRIWRRGRIWWIQFFAHGLQVRESSRSDRRPVAERFLRQRLGETAAGIAPPSGAARITYEQMRDTLLADYAANGRSWLRKDKNGGSYIIGVSHLDRFFAGYRAMNITTDAIRQFIKRRQEKGAANGTVNRELALLRRMLRLSVQDGKLRDVPHFPMLKEAPPRKGFLEHVDYQRLRQELPEHLRAILAVGYYTGMRRGEILSLLWANVDFLNAEIRLDPGTTKNDEPRTIPLIGELPQMLQIERQRNPGADFVFTQDGQRVVSFYKAWKSACKRAGLERLLFHDLRRSGLRNLVRAGVPERVAMTISGHKTRAVFERYNIVSGRDLKDAADKLEAYLAGQNGDKTGTIGPSERNGSSTQVEKVL